MINVYQITRFILHFLSAKRKGHGVHSPFAYALCEEVFYNTHAFYDFEELQTTRAQLLADTTRLETGSFGAGSKTFRSQTRRVKDIAARGISTPRQSQLFYKLVNYLKCGNCIELGTSLGLNTLYLAMANKAGQVTSIEGSPALSHFAKALAQKQGAENIRFINAAFDPAFAEQLCELPAPDLLYIDGNHTLEATLRYFEQALPKMKEQSVVILDDIYWSPEMTQAWEKIKNHSRVTLSVDTFYFGLVFFRTEIKEKTHLRFYL